MVEIRVNTGVKIPRTTTQRFYDIRTEETKG